MRLIFQVFEVHSLSLSLSYPSGSFAIIMRNNLSGDDDDDYTALSQRGRRRREFERFIQPLYNIKHT